MQNNESNGFFIQLSRDEGVQRAAAGVVVALIVAAARRAIFPTNLG